MEKPLEVGIIGLGKFGMQLGTSLAELGQTVIGLDSDPARVRVAQDIFSQAYEGNAEDKAVLQQLRFQDFNTVVVSVGNSMETSILCILSLQEVGIKNLIVKAASLEHRKVLKRLGVPNVIQPETDVAIQMARRLCNPGMVDLLPLGGGTLVQEVTIESWAGKTLVDLNLMSLGVMAAAIKRKDEKEYSFVPSAVEPLAKGDNLVLIGKEDAILSFTT